VTAVDTAPPLALTESTPFVVHATYSTAVAAFTATSTALEHVVEATNCVVFAAPLPTLTPITPLA
jgi:hypothetical protein